MNITTRGFLSMPENLAVATQKEVYFFIPVSPTVMSFLKGLFKEALAGNVL